MTVIIHRRNWSLTDYNKNRTKNLWPQKGSKSAKNLNHGLTRMGTDILPQRTQRGGAATPVAQTSKFAVSRVSKSADCTTAGALPTWKSAIQQVWKPALQRPAVVAWKNPRENE
jgi:hypothetical protein